MKGELLPLDSVFCIPFYNNNNNNNIYLTAVGLSPGGSVSPGALQTNVRIKIYRTVVLLVVLFGYETWSLSH
jgi:hypothetical protein